MKSLLEKLKPYKIFLASKSPRRKQLLAGMGINFETISKDTEEDFDDTLNPEEIARMLSQKKSEAFAENELPSNYLLITADTIVVLEQTIINKASDDQEAAKMLQLLSGKTHQVITGITLRSREKTLSFSEQSEVVFDTLSQEDIARYIQHYQPFDKAGAYGIQEWIGYIGIKKINGSFYNVMGLPTHRLYETLKQF